MFFCYLQLRHAIILQFHVAPTVTSHTVKSCLTSSNADKYLSSLRISARDTGKNTQLFNTWQGDIPSLSSEDWDEGVQQYIPLVIYAKDKYIQLKILHRANYTPQSLSKIYKICPTQSGRCPKCLSDTGTFIHVVWTCPLIQQFWREVVEQINAVGDLNVDVDPRILLLGICDTIDPSIHKQRFIFYAAFNGRRAILSKWKKTRPPPWCRSGG